jgi:hypothetical protein
MVRERQYQSLPLNSCILVDRIRKVLYNDHTILEGTPSLVVHALNSVPPRKVFFLHPRFGIISFSPISVNSRYLPPLNLSFWLIKQSDRNLSRSLTLFTAHHSICPGLALFLSNNLAYDRGDYEIADRDVERSEVSRM